MDKDDLEKAIEDNLAAFSGKPATEETKSDMMNVLLPVLKRMLPTVIAADIVGVQPMMPTQMQIGFTPGIEHAYWAEPMASPSSIFNYDKFDDKHQEQVDWCLETFREEDWMASTYKFYFKHKKDRDWFVLRWS